MLAAQERRTLVDAFAYRHHPIVNRAREIVQSNKLGSVRSISVAVRMPFFMYGKDKLRALGQQGSGAMVLVGVHAIHLLRFIMGAEPRALRAEARVLDKKTRCGR